MQKNNQDNTAVESEEHVEDPKKEMLFKENDSTAKNAISIFLEKGQVLAKTLQESDTSTVAAMDILVASSRFSLSTYLEVTRRFLKAYGIYKEELSALTNLYEVKGFTHVTIEPLVSNPEMLRVKYFDKDSNPGIDFFNFTVDKDSKVTVEVLVQNPEVLREAADLPAIYNNIYLLINTLSFVILKKETETIGAFSDSHLSIEGLNVKVDDIDMLRFNVEDLSTGEHFVFHAMDMSKTLRDSAALKSVADKRLEALITMAGNIFEERFPPDDGDTEVDESDVSTETTTAIGE